MSKVPSPGKSKSPKPRPKPRTRGLYGLSVPEAGAMIGLGRNASYEAAKAGDIPVMKIGALKIVPRAKWLQLLGRADDAA